MKDLIDRFKQARNDFIKIINQISPNKREIVCAGDWTAKNILSHLIGWTDFQNNILKDFMEGKRPVYFSNILQYNTESVNKRRLFSWNKVCEELLDSTDQLIIKYKELSEDLWNKPIWKDKKATPVKLIEIETRHYLGEHLDQIKKCVWTPCG